MPEYLAPGVYVEETSFRAKSIEGVSTSTTAFAGVTRKGPYHIPGIREDTPELLTSFGDFERIYGGIDDLAPGRPNLLAHAVRAYFDNGGSRLFVSRVFRPTGADADPTALGPGSTRAERAAFGIGTSPDFVAGATGPERARFVARFPGSAGNGRITVREVATPATLRSIDAAPVGSLLRIGGRQPARPARLEGGRGPFALPDGGRLLLTVGEDEVDIEVHGEPAEAVGDEVLDDPITIPAADATLRVTVDGVAQAIALPTAETPLAELVALINAEIRGGSAGLTDADDAPAGRLVIRSDRRGTSASVIVQANPTLGFAGDVTVSGAAEAANNVGDLLSVTADDLNALFEAEDLGVRASVDPVSGRLVLTTTEAGDAASIEVRAGAGSQHAALGLLAGAEAEGVEGSAVAYFVKTPGGWRDGAAPAQPLDLTEWQATGSPAVGADLLTLSVLAEDADGHDIAYDDLGFDRRHPRFAGDVLALEPARRGDALENAFALEVGESVTPFALRDALFPAGGENLIPLEGGNDGAAPNAQAYRDALAAFERIEDISIVAAPDAAADRALARQVHNELITHVERRRAYRIAVLDVPRGMTPMEAVEVRGFIDSTRAALYYPWVVVPNPLARPGEAGIAEEIAVPPSGFVCGIYARTDVERGVFKAPANEVVRGALRFEQDINFAQQELLNPRGVNCLRHLPGRGFRVWGARTASSDPEWKYVNIRRYFNYLERSIDQGTQWAVFEPNGERLWSNIRETIASFLYNEWVSGALLGEKPEHAFFVRCDRSTMTQNDLDNGRLICLIGVAAIKPAEFVIFRIGQKTADARA